ncbi:succinate dehydrogenase [Klebsiella pneumoniae]|nr:succinate dehydrogenase [Klebsiella pneumoniae]
MRTCMIAGGNILFYSITLSAISSLHAVNKVILAAFIVG